MFTLCVRFFDRLRKEQLLVFHVAINILVSLNDWLMNTFRFTCLHCLLLSQFHYSLRAGSLEGENAKGRRREEWVASRFLVPTSEPARRLILLSLLDILSTDLNVKYIELIKYHTLSNWKAFQRWSWWNVNQDCERFPLRFKFAEKSANTEPTSTKLEWLAV